MSRSHPYEDPLDAIWIECASRIGLRVERSADTYASTDGRGTLLLGDRASLDPDDCLAQMVFHELCHSLVCGRESFDWIDWGLDNESGRDVDFEYATLRLQSALLGPLGLRRVLAPTTEYRTFYDDLPSDPFLEREPSERSSIIRGRAAYARRLERPWGPHLEHALAATADILEQTARYRGTGPGDLLGQLEPRARVHRSGNPIHHAASAPGAPEHPGPFLCGDCAWFLERASGRHGCRQAKSARIEREDIACSHFEPTLDCLACGACCREAYDSVDVSARDAALLPQSLLLKRGARYELPRPEHRCSALSGGTRLPLHRPAIPGPGGEAEQVSPPFYLPSEDPFSCAIYDARPKTCRDFEKGSAHCLSARRRVGLSR